MTMSRRRLDAWLVRIPSGGGLKKAAVRGCAGAGCNAAGALTGSKQTWTVIRSWPRSKGARRASTLFFSCRWRDGLVSLAL